MFALIFYHPQTALMNIKEKLLKLKTLNLVMLKAWDASFGFLCIFKGLADCTRSCSIMSYPYTSQNRSCQIPVSLTKCRTMQQSATILKQSGEYKK